MRLTLENIIAIAALILTEAWFLNGYLNGRPEFEPAIAFIVALGAIFAKDPIKEKFGIGGKTRRHDQALFQELQRALPAEPTLRLLKEHDFGNSFRKQYVEPLYEFVATWDTVEKEFLDGTLEKKRKSLYADARALAYEIAHRTVPLSDREFASVFSDRLRNSGQPRPDSVIEDAKVLNDKATQFVPKYEEFVRVCRAKLVE